MKGKLYGIGTGPGDPELLTLKALRYIRDAQVIAVPGEAPRESIAYEIAERALEKAKKEGFVSCSLADKKVLAIPMPMTKDAGLLETAQQQGAEQIKERLEAGENVVFLTLGDPTIYSTYLYIQKRIKAEGYETGIVSGIPSFCAAAARIGTGLVEQSQQLHVIPASYQIEEALELPGTKVLMKAGKKISQVKEQLKQKNAEGMMIENCGMVTERIYRTVEEIPETAGYYSLIIIKEKEV